MTLPRECMMVSASLNMGKHLCAIAALTVEPFDLHHCKARWRLTLRSASRSTLFPIKTNGNRSGSVGAACHNVEDEQSQEV